AALALRNAESFEEHSRQARVQRGFYRIAAALGQPVSLEETLDALAQAAAEALGGSSAAVLMPGADDLRLAGLHSLPGPLVRFLENGLGDPSGPLRSAARRWAEGDDLVVRAARGTDGDPLESRLPSTARLAGDAFQSRASVSVADARDDNRLLQADPVLASGYAGCLAVPLVGPEGTVRGVLSVYSQAPRVWRDDEIEALGAFAANASAALSGAELYQSVALERDRSDAIRSNIAEGIVAID